MKRLATLSAALVIGVGSLPGPVLAETNSTVSRIEEQIEGIQQQVVKMDSTINQFQNEKAILKNHIERLKTAILDNREKIKEAKEESFRLETEIQELKLNIKPLQERISVIPTYDSTLLPIHQRNLSIPSALETTKQIITETETLNMLIEKEEEITSKLKKQQSLELELKGMAELLSEQIAEKDKLLSELEIKEKQNHEAMESLEKESQMLSKQKTVIESAIENEKARKEGTLGDLQVDKPKTSIVVSTFSTDQVPPEYMKYYLHAEKEYGIPWYYLASIHGIETEFSKHPTMISSVGAVGHLQFMPATWVGHKYETSGGLVAPDIDITDLNHIKAGSGFGVDADNDGIASPWSIVDSVASAAKYLSSHGFKKDVRKAIWHYNHADWYVDKVIAQAELYKNSMKVNEDGEINIIPGADNEVTTIGNRWINNSVYVFGGGRSLNDIKMGMFDCSSFVHWAFSKVGVNLGELTSVSTETLKNLGTPINVEDMQPGDLVFFDTYKKDGHVGIYLGDGNFIGAQSSTGVAIANMNDGFWKEKFNQRVKRIDYVKK
ncbi:NlpC/P60 family protein (plasmid) [Cytobacillus pseudoceanisediminis]|uniref:bifunctional lytic transglycosylase/C40 family peptidase n=1 Tax=Cytobacillus pseudoceanisediminis TaxID=3051614 RepID=UPI002185522F|nr:bifunctional lytic transglycosylase/C40 family peptidase [Cytobacillus pseudoceanisediminis]UQX57128.1 NlpC/P60 family protein [Cytobacillus pseudoceanisediminis]